MVQFTCPHPPEGSFALPERPFGLAFRSPGGHIRYSRIPNTAMELKPQDLLVLLKAAAHGGQRWTYAALGEALSISSSEAHASVKRAVASGLAVAPARGAWSPVRPALLEFIEHGVRYVWPATLGPV